MGWAGLMVVVVARLVLLVSRGWSVAIVIAVVVESHVVIVKVTAIVWPVVPTSIAVKVLTIPSTIIIAIIVASITMSRPLIRTIPAPTPLSSTSLLLPAAAIVIVSVMAMISVSSVVPGTGARSASTASVAVALRW